MDRIKFSFVLLILLTNSLFSNNRYTHSIAIQRISDFIKGKKKRERLPDVKDMKNVRLIQRYLRTIRIAFGIPVKGKNVTLWRDTRGLHNAGITKMRQVEKLSILKKWLEKLGIIHELHGKMNIYGVTDAAQEYISIFCKEKKKIIDQYPLSIERETFVNVFALNANTFIALCKKYSLSKEEEISLMTEILKEIDSKEPSKNADLVLVDKDICKKETEESWDSGDQVNKKLHIDNSINFSQITQSQLDASLFSPVSLISFFSHDESPETFLKKFQDFQKQNSVLINNIFNLQEFSNFAMKNIKNTES